MFNPMANMHPWVLGQQPQVPQIPTEPVVPTIGGGTFPTHPVVTTPTPEAAPAPTPNCPPGYRWDAASNSCVPVASSGPAAPQEDPTQSNRLGDFVITARTGWPQGYDVNNPPGQLTGPLKNFVGGLGLGSTVSASGAMKKALAEDPDAMKITVNGKPYVLHTDSRTGGLVLSGGDGSQSIHPSEVLDKLVVTDPAQREQLAAMVEKSGQSGIGSMLKKAVGVFDKYIGGGIEKVIGGLKEQFPGLTDLEYQSLAEQAAAQAQGRQDQWASGQTVAGQVHSMIGGQMRDGKWVRSGDMSTADFWSMDPGSRNDAILSGVQELRAKYGADRVPPGIWTADKLSQLAGSLAQEEAAATAAATAADNSSDDDATPEGNQYSVSEMDNYADSFSDVDDYSYSNKGGLISMGERPMYRNNGGTIQMAAQQVAGLANKASDAAMQAQEAVNEVAGVIGSNNNPSWIGSRNPIFGGGQMAQPMMTSSISSGPGQAAYASGNGSFGSAQAMGGGQTGSFSSIGSNNALLANLFNAGGFNSGGVVYRQVGGPMQDVVDVDAGAPAGAQLSDGAVAGAPMDPMAGGMPPMGGAPMPPAGGAPMAPPAPAEPPRMTFAEKVAEARAAIKGGGTSVPTNPLPTEAPMGPQGMMDGQGDGPVAFGEGAGHLTEGEVGPDMGPDDVDAMVPEGAFVMNAEGTAMNGPEIDAMEASAGTPSFYNGSPRMIRAKLTKGERVIAPHVVNMYRDRLEAMNQGGLAARAYNMGGVAYHKDGMEVQDPEAFRIAENDRRRNQAEGQALAALAMGTDAGAESAINYAQYDQVAPDTGKQDDEKTEAEINAEVVELAEEAKRLAPLAASAGDLMNGWTKLSTEQEEQLATELRGAVSDEELSVIGKGINCSRLKVVQW